MNPSKICGYRTTFLLTTLLAGASLLGAANDAATTAVSPATVTAASQSQTDEISRLKATLAEQQKQLQSLQQTLQNQQALLEKALGTQSAGGNSGASSGNFNTIGQVASTTPMIPIAPLPVAHPGPAIPGPRPQDAGGAGGNPCEAPEGGPAPPYLRLGDVCIQPIGFMDLTSVFRDKNAGSSMGSNFGSVPYNNTANGNLTEYRIVPQNSRIGFRIDGDYMGTHFIGYNEFDFNGTSGSNGIGVSNGAFVPRLRLFWVDARKGKVEFLAGQSWSMMTPNRNGISALPGDLFYTQVIDINYMAGLTWTRQPGVRILYHPNEHVTFGVSAENPDQYAGGSAGGSGITLPSALTGLANTQLDVAQNVSAGQNILSQPTVTPDIMAKVAFDYSRFHFEVGGVESDFKTTNIAAIGTTPAFNTHYTTQGGGLLFGFNAEVLKGFRVISTNFYSDGEGRYLFGQAPDIIVRANGQLSPVHSDGTIDGVEATVKNTLLYAYYGGIYIGRNVALDANGTSLVGYGYKGSPNSQNRAINEITFGFNQTIWRDVKYGAINLMGQYEYLERDPWYVAIGAPKATHDNTIYFNVRYSLPGSMPKF
jgi:hypothetical protein